MKLKLILSLFLIVSPLLAQEASWEYHRDQYLDNSDDVYSSVAYESLLAIGRLGNKEAVPFLREVKQHGLHTLSSIYDSYPELSSSRSHPGAAHIALATLGDEEAWQELTEQTFHENELLRHGALLKVKLIQSDRAIEALSNFIGDPGGDEFFGSVELLAVNELLERLDDPPFAWSSNIQSADYRNYGRASMLRWRYETFGVIPGREQVAEP